jgi:hypothetical protein
MVKTKDIYKAQDNDELTLTVKQLRQFKNFAKKEAISDFSENIINNIDDKKMCCLYIEGEDDTACNYASTQVKEIVMEIKKTMFKELK